MSTPVRTPQSSQDTDPWRRRVDSGDWDAITAEVNEYGGALLPQLVGRVADLASLSIAFLVPAAAYLGIAFFAAATSRKAPVTLAEPAQSLH